VHYKGTFLDGKQFDSSYDRNQTFPVVIGETKLIPGFTQGLIGMKQGGKRKVVIPYELAYGEQGRPPVIPPMATLQFELEIVKLTPKG
jgi:FKBP-type peptidyl-prolyl cis-trans isomerase